MHNDLGAILQHKGGTVHSVTPKATVAEAVAKMNELKIGALVVMEGDRLTGIFTERDVLVRVVSSGADPTAVSIADVMTTDLVVVKPSTLVEEAMVIVTEKRCRHLPVVEGGRLSGMVSIGDLTRWVVRHQQHRIDDLVGYITGGYPS